MKHYASHLKLFKCAKYFCLPEGKEGKVRGEEEDSLSLSVYTYVRDLPVVVYLMLSNNYMRWELLPP